MNIPNNSSEITAEWLSSVLFPVSAERKIASIEIDDNFGPWSLLGKAVRVKIKYLKKGMEPKSVIVKFQVSCSEPKKEGEIYQLLSEASVPFVPKLFGLFGNGNLVLEDFSPTHEVVYADFTLDQARSVVSMIAEVNNLFWKDARVPKDDPSHFINSISINFSQGWDNFKHRYEEQIGKLSSDFEWMRKNAALVANQYVSGPATLNHADVNRSNLLFPKEGKGKVILIDWQLAGQKTFAFDLSYFLVKVLTVEQRREYEEIFLKEYYAMLSDQIRSELPFDQLVLHYRACLTRSMLSAVTRLGPKFDGSPKRFETADRLAMRVIKAMKDLRPIEAIQELEKRGFAKSV